MKNLWIIVLLVMFAAFQAGAAPAENTLEGSLAVGEVAKDFTLPNAYGKEVNLHAALKKGPVVLSFYRGSWCPVCNRQLHEYQESLADIKEKGAQLIAISPETPTHAELNIVQNHLTFEVLSDKGNDVAKAYGIVWHVPEADREKFSGWLKESTGKTLKDYNDKEGYELPVPATFVINTDGKVIYAFKDVDYTKRADIKDILTALESIK